MSQKIFLMNDVSVVAENLFEVDAPSEARRQKNFENVQIWIGFKDFCHFTQNAPLPSGARTHLRMLFMP